MAKVKLNPIVEQVRGQVGQLVFRQSYGQQVVGRKADPSDHESTPGQIAARDRFREAALYGRVALANPATKKLYADAADKKGKPVFSMVMADFLNAPSIDEIDVSEYTGRKPADDFKIVMQELESFSEELVTKPMIVVASKIDVAQDPKRLDSLRRLAKRRNLPFFAISAVTGQGLPELLRAMANAVFQPQPEAVEQG